MPGNLELVGKLQRNVCCHWKALQIFRLFVWWGLLVSWFFLIEMS